MSAMAIFQQISFRSPRTRIRDLDILFSMPLPLTERIKELRREISEINRQNGEFWLSGKRDSFKLADQQRRLQRLQEIKEELASLTAWKKL
jgi:hypothetical protein